MLKIKNIKISDLKFAEYNPRTSTKKQEKALSESLAKFGCVEPIIVNENPNRYNVIIGGHFRVRELKKLDYKDVLVKKKGSVLDPFCGTGTTLIACEKLNRKCYAIELTPLYCDVIIQRWQNLTGKDAIRFDNKKFNEV